jgi:hypothetical protein
MRAEYGNIKVGLEEIFFYDPNTEVTNVCRMCSMSDCPVPDKDIVSYCNSFKFVKIEEEPKLTTEWRVVQGMTVCNDRFAYMSTIAS